MSERKKKYQDQGSYILYINPALDNKNPYSQNSETGQLLGALARKMFMLS